MPLFFAALLIFGQQQAMLHAFSHSSDLQQSSTNLQAFSQNYSAAVKTSSENHSTNHSEVCAKCLSLAGLDAVIGSLAQVINITSGQFALSTALNQSVLCARFSSYLSRAPPILT